MTDLAQALLALIVCTAIPGDERLPIFDAQLPFINPYGDTLPGQPLLRIDIEALNTDKAIGIHGPQELHPAKEAAADARASTARPRTQPKTSTGVRRLSARS